VAFAKRLLKKPQSFFDKIRLSDECNINIDGVGVQFARKRDDESWYDDRFIYQKQYGKVKPIMIWAMIDEEELVRMKWLNEHR
jgi:hypothetical protein